MNKSLWIAVALVVGLARAPEAFAHAGVHERLAKVSAAIERSPRDASLYARRGVLRCEHGETSSAAADFRKARALAPGDTRHERKIARAWLRAEQPKRALRAVDRRLKVEPDDAPARWLRGVALARLHRPQQARPELERALAALDQPRSYHYLERARVMQALGAEHRTAAVAGIEEGIARLGPRVELVEEAVTLYAELGQPQLALELIGRLPPRLRDGPRWQGRRGDLLAAQGSTDEARGHYQAALATIDAYPASRRETRAMMRLRAELDARLTTLAPG